MDAVRDYSDSGRQVVLWDAAHGASFVCSRFLFYRATLRKRRSFLRQFIIRFFLDRQFMVRAQRSLPLLFKEPPWPTNTYSPAHAHPSLLKSLKKISLAAAQQASQIYISVRRMELTYILNLVKALHVVKYSTLTT